ncbi:MAG TPA: sigma-70 family RNA polymerase sigma factor [Nocardioidaceae bacterium]|nr:sigma-70 family RNA polymerase sigma factor [Nocardioidaceae bacterium]
MTTANETSPTGVKPPAPDESWVVDLASDGPAGAEAVRHLHGILLRASRHQVWRLRDLLPGAGAGELEDLAQQSADEAAVSVLRQLSTFEGRSRFTTWAYKFAIYQAGVEVRRQAWRNREIGLPDHVDLVDRGSSPADLTEAAQLARAVEDAIATALTPHQRRVALALVIDQVPIDVLAERLGTSRNALYKTLHDARRRLRTSLVTSGHLDQLPDRSTS